MVDRPRVLVVDDEPDTVDSLCDLLESHMEVEALGAYSAAEARGHLRQPGRRPVLMVVDHAMQHETGLDFLLDARRRWPEVRGILMTALMGVEQDPEQGPAVKVLLKPLEPETILGEVRAALAARRPGRPPRDGRRGRAQARRAVDAGPLRPERGS